MALKARINIEFRTTWVFLAMRLFTWLKAIRLLRLLSNSIIGRTYINGKISSVMRFNITNNQLDIRIDSCGGEVGKASDIKL